jgi:N-acetylglutamate synthase-like GNAT family acetyltransferase
MIPQTGTIPFFRPAKESDEQAIMKIVASQDLLYKTLHFNAFHLAEIDGKIGSVLRLEAFDHFYFLSSLGTDQALEGHGLASGLIQSIQKNITKPIYLYTIIPGFFTRLGFLPLDPPRDIPPRSLYSCVTCEPLRCVCMVFRPEEPHQP